MTYKLRTLVPALMAALVAGNLAMSYQSGLADSQAWLLETARRDGLALVDRLGRLAEQDLTANPSRVEADLLLSAIDLRTDVLLITDAAQRILTANRRVWQGQELAAVWPALSPQQAAALKTQQAPQVIHQAPQHLLSVVSPFNLPGDEREIRSNLHGLVVLVFDLSPAYAQAQRQALKRLLPMALMSLGALALVWWGLRRQVGRPLLRMKEASQAFMNEPDRLHPAPEQGPQELADLGRALNRLQARVRDSRAQLRESESHFRMLADAGHLRVWGLAPQGEVDYANGGLSQLLGWTPDTIEDPGQWNRLLQQPANDHARETVLAAWSQQRPFSVELQVETGTGEARWLLCDGSARHDAAQRWTGYWVQGLDVTQSKREVSALQESEQRLASLINSAMDAIISTDIEQRILLFNPAAERMFGCRAEEVLGQTISRFLPGSARAIHAQHLQRLMQEDEPARPNHLMGGRVLFARRADGSEFPIETSISHMRVGHQHLFTAIVRDVTERERAQAELKSREGIFAAIADQAHESIVLVAPDTGRFLEFNRAAHQDLGYSAAEFARLELMDIAPQGQAGDRVAQLRRLAQNETAVLEDQLRRKDGSLRDVRISAQAVQVRGKLRLAAIWADITEERAQTRELMAYRTQLQTLVEERTAELQRATLALQSISEEQIALFDAAPVGIALVKDGVILRSNRHMEALLRAAPGSLTGKPAPLLGIHLTLPQPASPLPGDSRTLREQQLARQDGSLFWARLTGQFLDSRQPENGALFIVEDIEQEHAAAEALHEAKELAESAGRMKSEFLANMSHEIRTPLNAVLGMAHLTLRTPLSAKQQGYLNNIQSAGQHLLTLLNDLLDLSKIEAGKMDLEIRTFGLDTVLSSLRALIAPAAAAKGLELVFDVDADVPRTLEGDALRLGQILINYASNAVKFTEAGEVAVKVRQLEARPGQTHLRFEVRDTGIGLTAEQRRQLFVAFQQADPTTTRKFGGTGLGLSIAKRLASLMGGSVGVESQLGQGSTFWVNLWLPVGRQENAPSPTELRGLRVLLVDDNAHACEALRQLMERWGVAVEAMGSADAALTHLQQAPAPDWILVDHHLNGAAGSDLLHAIQALRLAPAPHLALMTEPPRLDPVASLPKGCQELAKPPTASDLLDLLMNGLSSAALPSRHPDTPWAQGRRILLVEDNLINRQVAQELLAETGAEVLTADNGEVALNRLQQEGPFDLVFMDMQMPVLDGVEATRRLRQNAQWQELPVVAMTANALAQDRELCLSVGMNDFLTKPIEPDRLAELLRRWLPAAPPLVAPPSQSLAIAEPAAEEPTAPLDRVKGLRACLGREAMYQRLLEQFVQQYRDEPQRLEQDWRAGRHADAERRAHTLKGVAAQLGARPLAQSAQALELALHEARARPDPDWPATLAATLERQLAATVAAIAQLPPASPTPPPVFASTEAYAALVEGLTQRLRQGDPDARDWLRTHETALRLGMGARFQAVERAIENFDFELALIECQEERQTL